MSYIYKNAIALYMQNMYKHIQMKMYEKYSKHLHRIKYAFKNVKFLACCIVKNTKYNHRF